MKLLLEEDDCAPDSFEYFSTKFKEIVGESVNDFSKKSSQSINGVSITYKKGEFILTLSGDDRTFKLYTNKE